MKRFAVVDEPIALLQLLDAASLHDLLASVTRLLPVTLCVLDRDGVALSRAGTVPPLLDVSTQWEHREALVHCGDIVGTLLLARTSSRSEPETNLEAVAAHLRLTLEMLIGSAYARALTSSLHEAAMQESFSELGDRNQRLASALERLEEIEDLKSNFLATISHELRTPLTAIMGYGEMMARGLGGELSAEQNEYIGTILTNSEHLLRLITGILDVSLIEARALRLSLEPICMVSLLASVAKTMKREMKVRKIVLTLPKGEYPKAMGDLGKLRQVVMQLMANAIKFSPDGGDVRISVAVGALSQQDESLATSPFWRDQLSERFGLRVTIADQGIGVASQQRAAIFEPFYQADSSTTRAFGGTGLGLSMARSYVVAHGGFLWIDSVPSPGGAAPLGDKGSSFTFSVPAVPSDLAAYVAAAREGESPAESYDDESISHREPTHATRLKP